MGMGRVWQPNSYWRSHQILENMFMTYGPTHFLMHPRFYLPFIFGAAGNSPWTFLQCSSLFTWLGSGFVDIQWLGSLLGVFVLFLHSHGREFCVFYVAQPMGGKYTNLGDEGVDFSHVNP